jgi:hypothetical protein
MGLAQCIWTHATLRVLELFWGMGFLAFAYYQSLIYGLKLSLNREHKAFNPLESKLRSV